MPQAPEDLPCPRDPAAHLAIPPSSGCPGPVRRRGRRPAQPARHRHHHGAGAGGDPAVPDGVDPDAPRRHLGGLGRAVPVRGDRRTLPIRAYADRGRPAGPPGRIPAPCGAGRWRRTPHPCSTGAGPGTGARSRRSPLIPNDPRASSTYLCFDSTTSRSPCTEPSHRSSGSSSVCSAARRRARSSYHPVTHLRRSVISGSSSLYAAKSSSGKTLTPARWSRIVSRSRSGS